MASKKLRVGIIGCGDVAQIVHLPTLQLLSHLFTTSAVCDVSLKTAKHCATKFFVPLATTNPEEIFQNPEIDLVFVLPSDEFHAPYTIAALNAGKNVFLEKPITIGLTSGKEISEAEKNAPNGARVFMGYMRRYAASLEAFKRETSTIKSIKYARVRDIIGPNSYFMGQSGTHSAKYVDDISEAASAERKKRLAKLISEAWNAPFETLSHAQLDYCTLLGSLGSHGLSLMREVLGGLPQEILASTDNARWYTAMLDYRNKTNSHEPFTCVYEMGIDSVPRFDSQVAVFGEDKSVTICYETPFVKGLGITVEIDELNEFGEKVHRSIQSSYEDAYTREMYELYECMVNGATIKTSVEDALQDLQLFDMMFKAYPAHKRDKAADPEGAGFLPSGP